MTDQALKINNVQEYEGDLLTANVDAIIHQCNCMSKGAAGLAAYIFDMVPEANTYDQNPEPRRFGIYQEFAVTGQSFKNVVNAFTQLNTGPPTWGLDTEPMRLTMFRKVLTDYLGSHPNIKSVGFPKYYGSALAGGNWYNYRNAILWAADLYQDVQFHIVEKRTF